MDKRNGWNNGQRWLTDYYGKSYSILHIKVDIDFFKTQIFF